MIHHYELFLTVSLKPGGIAENLKQSRYFSKTTVYEIQIQSADAGYHY